MRKRHSSDYEKLTEFHLKFSPSDIFIRHKLCVAYEENAEGKKFILLSNIESQWCSSSIYIIVCHMKKICFHHRNERILPEKKTWGERMLKYWLNMKIQMKFRHNFLFLRFVSSVNKSRKKSDEGKYSYCSMFHKKAKKFWRCSYFLLNTKFIWNKRTCCFMYTTFSNKNDDILLVS